MDKSEIMRLKKNSFIKLPNYTNFLFLILKQLSLTIINFKIPADRLHAKNIYKIIIYTLIIIKIQKL